MIIMETASSTGSMFSIRVNVEDGHLFGGLINGGSMSLMLGPLSLTGSVSEPLAWQRLDPRADGTDFDPQTLIHEDGARVGSPRSL